MPSAPSTPSLAPSLSRQRSIRDVLGQQNRYLLRFNGGADSYVTVKDNDASPPWTAEFWVRRDGPRGVYKAPKPAPLGRATSSASSSARPSMLKAFRVSTGGGESGRARGTATPRPTLSHGAASSHGAAAATAPTAGRARAAEGGQPRGCCGGSGCGCG